MKDILKKSKKIILKMLVGLVYGIVITLSVVLMVSILGISIIALITCAAISIPIVIISAIVQFISQNIKFHKLKKVLLKSLHEKYEYQKDYSIKRVNSVKIIKDKNNEKFYAEEFIPVNKDELDILKSTIPESCSYDIAKIIAYETIQDKILKETNKSNLEKLKQELIYLSFELQDIATAHNTFLKDCETSEEIYEKKDVLRKIKTINN